MNDERGKADDTSSDEALLADKDYDDEAGVRSGLVAAVSTYELPEEAGTCVMSSG